MVFLSVLAAGYLQERSGLWLAQVGMFGWIPFLVADLGGVGSSICSDRLVCRGIAPLRARKLTLACAACVAPICALTPHLPHAAATLAIFSVVGAVCLTWLLNLGVVVAEAFPARNVGSVWGIADTFGAMALLHPLAAIVLWTLVRREEPPGDNAKRLKI